MKISIIGAGYVGLVTGVCLAKLGNDVTIIDDDTEKLSIINNKVSPIHEEGLDALLSQVNINAHQDYEKILRSDVVFLCVGTPVNEDGSTSLEQLIEASRRLGEMLERNEYYCVICVKSTVPPGSTEECVIPLLKQSGTRIGVDFGVCMSPEFLSEGRAVYDFMNPQRIIVGEYDNKSGDMLSTLYQSFNTPILRTDLRTAEIIKLASNASLAARISFINEIGNICKKLDIDVRQVAKGMGYDERIGNKYLNAGVGFGGSCLPKDIKMLIEKAVDIGYKPKLLEEISNVNEQQPEKILELLKQHIRLDGATVGILGLAFKAGTDDIRCSSSGKIVEVLLKEGAKVKAYDPVAVENFKSLFPHIAYVSAQEVLNSDATLLVTEWEEFNHLDYTGRIVIDGRGIVKAKEAKIYEGVCW